MKLVIPWALSALLLAGTVFLYSANKAKDTELERWRSQGQEADRLKAEGDQAKDPSAAAEAARLKADREELLSLRNEAQQLRSQTRQLIGQNGQLKNQLSAAMDATSKTAKTAQEAQAQLGQVTAEKEALAKLANIQSTIEQQASLCINNLRLIEAAKHQWAMENSKPPETVPTIADIIPFLPKNLSQTFTCPGGGGYNINAVNAVATCSIPGHALQQ